MGVGSADPERADASTARRRPPLPRQQPIGHEERRSIEVGLGIRLAEVEARRDQLVLECTDALDQAGNPRGRLEVAHVRLHRTDRAASALAHVGKGLSESTDLDRITEGGAYPLALDVLYGGWIDVGDGHRFGDDGGLPVEPGAT